MSTARTTRRSIATAVRKRRAINAHASQDHGSMLWSDPSAVALLRGLPRNLR